MADKLAEEAEAKWFTAKAVEVVEGLLGAERAAAVQEPCFMADFMRDSLEAEGEGHREVCH